MIIINELSSIPIYQQIYDQFIKLILLEVFTEGEKLPSVRELALNIKINPNTIQKAYKALEQDGFIESQKGKGNFVINKEQILKKYKDKLNRDLEYIVKEMILIGETEDMIKANVSQIIKERNDD